MYSIQSSGKVASMIDEHQSTEPSVLPQYQLIDPIESNSVQDLARLEARKVRAASFINKLQGVFAASQLPEAQDWKERLDQIEKLRKDPRTVVGIIGATGAGKSALSNALLDEERLIPTSCWRACTAVATEVSWNGDNHWPYKAQIVFIDHEEWKSELQILLSDLFDENGNFATDCKSTSSDAGIAYAKVSAVYPQLTSKQIAETGLDDLVAMKPAANVLGQTKQLKEHKASNLHASMKSFIDSKDKSAKATDKPALWPLIKVVRLFVKSPVLRSGITLVDLPGVQDSNQARSAIAKQYIKDCSGLWVTAPIVRAVDDKSAKDLMGDVFKRQLQLDGAFNTVTFVCTKSDDISVSEAADAMGVDLDHIHARDAEYSTKIKISTDSIDNLRVSMRHYANVLDEKEEDFEKHKKLLKRIQKGESVSDPGGKQPEGEHMAGHRRVVHGRKRKLDTSDDGEPNDAGSENVTPLLTEEIVKKRLEDLSSQYGRALNLHEESETRINDLEEDVRVTKALLSNSDNEVWQMCVLHRNEMSRDAIKHDFALGIQELEQELSASAEPDQAMIAEQHQNYDAIAMNLPVFCVSARGYQRLMGRLKRDKVVDQFNDIEQTEIPALQRHCQASTEHARLVSCRRFLNEVEILITSLQLWTAGEHVPIPLTKDRIKHEHEQLKICMKALQDECIATSTMAFASIRSHIKIGLARMLPNAVLHAKAAAMDTVENWHRPVNLEDRSLGGLPVSTYRAVVRRGGIYETKQKKLDFNDQMASPLLKIIAQEWVQLFQTETKAAFSNSARFIEASFANFRSQTHGGGLTMIANSVHIERLGRQLDRFQQKVLDAFDEYQLALLVEQKTVSRQFGNVVRKHLLPAYMDAAGEGGRGCFLRMKHIIKVAVSKQKEMMFDRAGTRSICELEAQVDKAESSLVESIGHACEEMERDYGIVFNRRQHKVIEKVQELQDKVAEFLVSHRSADPSTNVSVTSLILPCDDVKNEEEELKYMDETHYSDPRTTDDIEYDLVMNTDQNLSTNTMINTAGGNGQSAQAESWDF